MMTKDRSEILGGCTLTIHEVHEIILEHVERNRVSHTPSAVEDVSVTQTAVATVYDPPMVR